MMKRMQFIGAEKVRESCQKGQSCAVYPGHYCNWEWVTSLPNASMPQTSSFLRSATSTRTWCYANSDIVKESVKTTKLHKLVAIYRGAEMVMCEELTEE